MKKLDTEKLDELKRYNEKTTTREGFIMPNIEAFDTKISLAIKLWPQINSDGKIDYLLGKGVGVELALRGEVNGRKKHNNNFAYRCHSDFEIYDAPSINYDLIKNSEMFTYVFGAQEIFPKDSTKALHNLPKSLMDDTYDEVYYNGETYLIPELELLFLDKYLKKESTPREDGYDAYLLFREYDLDVEKILNYYDKYYLELKVNDVMEIYEPSISYNKTIDSLNGQFVKSAKSFCEAEGIEFSLETLNYIVNEEMIGYYKKKEVTPSVGRVPICLIPDRIEYVEEDGKYVLSEESKARVKEQADLIFEEKMEELRNDRQKLISTLDELEKLKSKKHKI